MKIKLSDLILINYVSGNRLEQRTILALFSIQSFSSVLELAEYKLLREIDLVVNNLVAAIVEQKFARQIKFLVPKLLHQSRAIALDIFLTFKSLFL